MELRCTSVFIVSLVSVIAATPHGYGVKGGAFSKADANAAAGAFGGFGEIPLSIPNGAGLSGSYSKSSSSSFASSSASSSSSSFNFNGLGSGSNGLSANGGCATAECQSNGNNGIHDSRNPGTTGSGQLYSGAKAVASAGALASAGSPSYSGNQRPCTSGDCSNIKPLDCEGSECDADDTKRSNKKCTSGQCESDSPIADSSEYNPKSKCLTNQCDPSQAGTDDIPVNVPKSTNYDKKSSGLTNNFGSVTTEISNKPATYLTAPKQQTSCTAPNCDLPGSVYDKENLPSSYNVPIHGPYIDTSFPAKDSCTSKNCENNQFNVPSSPSGSSSPGDCATGNCGGYSSEAPKIPNYSSGSTPFSGSTKPTVGSPLTQFGANPSLVSKYPSYLHSGPATTSGGPAGANTLPASTVTPAKQKLPPYTGGFGGPPGILKPNEYNTNIPTSIYKPSATAESHPAPCIFGNCGPQDSQSPFQSTPSNSPGVTQYNPATPTGTPKPAICSSGNCGPQPSLFPSQSVPSGFSGVAQHNPATPTGSYKPAICSSGNCGSQPSLFPSQSSPSVSPGVAQYNPVTPIGTYKPAICSSGNCGPQTSLFPSQSSPSVSPDVTQYNPATPTGTYKPAICSSGNCGSQPSLFPAQSSPSVSPGVAQYNPAISTGSYKPTSCSSGNCGSQPNQLHSQNNPSTTSSATHKPCSGNCETQPSQSIQHDNTGPAGFGGPVGILKPNDFNTPKIPSTSNIPSSPGGIHNSPGVFSPQHDHVSTPTQYKPTAPTASGSTIFCSSGNCVSQSSPSIQYNDKGSPNPTVPTSGFGGPAGILKPNEFNTPSKIPISNYKPSSPGVIYNSPGFSSPQHDHVNTPTQYQPTTPTGSGSTVFCSSGNCASQSSQSIQYDHTGSPNPTVPTSGFGGPAGILKPNEFNTPSKIPMSSYTPASPGGIYNPPGLSSPQNDHISSQAQFKPTTPTGSRPASCSSGNCESQSSQSIQYDHTSSSNPTVPTSGFGGPAGILKPNDFNSPSKIPSSSYKPASPVTGIYNTPGLLSPQRDQINSQTQHKPIAPTENDSKVCSTGNCGTQTSQTLPQYDQSSLVKPTSPAGTYPVSCSSGNCGSRPQYVQNGSINKVTTETETYNPTSCSSGNCSPYSGTPSSQYGYKDPPQATGPTGENNPVPCSSGKCGSQPGQPSSHDQTVPVVSAGTNKPISCSSGNCGSQIGQSSPPYSQTGPSQTTGINNGVSCTTGNCRLPSCASGNCGAHAGHPTGQYGQNIGALAASSAVANANAVAYTGGFGGPPGFLKPYDGGKLGGVGSLGFGGKYPTSTLPGAAHGFGPSGIHSSYGKSINDAGSLIQTGIGTHASAISGASAFGVGDNKLGGYKSQSQVHDNDHNNGGCKGDCGSNFGTNGGFLDGLNTPSAFSKSAATAGAGSFGLGGSFASSSASAHASAGAATKGGYGKR